MKGYCVTVQEKDDIAIRERSYYESMNPGYRVTGATLHESFPDGTGTTYIVFSGDTGHKRTPYQMCRDCGNHYIIARYDRFDRVDKATLSLTTDVDDQ